MKKLLLLLLLIPSLIFAQNRYATLADVNKYGDYITVGDFIIDTPTKKYSDGINQVAYVSFSKNFPNIREDANIWVDGDKLGRYAEFRLVGWNIKSATIRPIPNTRMDGVYTANSYGGFLYLIQGLTNLIIDGGSTDKYPGLSQFPKDRVFLKGSFGIGSSSQGIYTGYHAFSLSVLDGGSITIKNIEGEHGFSVIRLQGGNLDQTVSVTIEDCYLHDSNSELTYIGATHGAPLSKIKDLIIRRCILARSGSESLQMQHLVGSAHVSNATIFDADASYIHQFMPGQDTGIQLSADQGNAVLENILLDSWGSNGLNIFGSSAFPNGGNSVTTIKNILFNNGRGSGIYIHNSAKYGMKWELNDLYFRKPNNEYYKKNKVKAPDYLISGNNGTDTITFGNIYHDNTLPKVFQNSIRLLTGKSGQLEMPEPEYVRSGFYEPANKIRVWYEKYIGYIAGNDTTSTYWAAGDIAQDIQTGSPPIFCKALTSHYAKSIRPRDNPKFMRLTWDVKGIRNDQPNWDKNSLQRSDPPDDLRVKAGSYWAQKGIGFIQEGDGKDQVIVELQEKIKVLMDELIEVKKKVKDFANSL